jgi:hypothetical protein
MSRKQLASAVIVLTLSYILIGSASAQAVKVVDKPGDGQWTISFSRKNGPDVFELDTFRKTKAEALQEAERLKAWSNSMDANSSWRLAVILIEGEDAHPAKASTGDGGQDSPKVRDPVQMLQDANKRLMDELSKTLNDINKEVVKNALEKKNRELQDDIKRVTKAKEYLVKNVNKLTDDDFKQINGLISSYNGRLDTYRSEPNGAAFSNYSRMNPVSASSLEKVRRWKAAKAKQAQLANDKRKLDGEKSRIDQERRALAQEGRAIRDEQARLRALREQARGGGPYYLQYDELRVFGGDIPRQAGPFDTYEAAKAASKNLGFIRAEKQITIMDGAGQRFDLDTYTPPKKVDAAELEKAEDELRQRQAEYQRRLQKYQQELLSGYNQTLTTHQGDIQSHAADVQSLEQ